MTDLLARISARHRNHITSAQILFSEIAGIMAKVREWHEQVDHMSGQQLVAMLFIIQKMQSDLNEIRQAGPERNDLEIIEVQAQTLHDITIDVISKLKALGTDIDIILAEAKPEEMARIILEQSRNDATLIYTEEVRKIQRQNDFPGLVAYLNDNTAFDIVAALLQLPNDKATEIVRLIKEV